MEHRISNRFLRPLISALKHQNHREIIHGQGSGDMEFDEQQKRKI
jgi:hypothetical protein